MFTLQNTPSGELQLPGLTLRPVEHEGTTAKFELSLTLGEGPEGFGGALSYNTDLFDAEMDGLKALAATDTLRVPSPIMTGESGEPPACTGDVLRFDVDMLCKAH